MISARVRVIAFTKSADAARASDCRPLMASMAVMMATPQRTQVFGSGVRERCRRGRGKSPPRLAHDRTLGLRLGSVRRPRGRNNQAETIFEKRQIYYLMNDLEHCIFGNVFSN